MEMKINWNMPNTFQIYPKANNKQSPLYIKIWTFSLSSFEI